MKVSLVQTDIVWADKEANLNKFEAILSPLSGMTDLAVLPEMFTTGFCTDELHLAETMDGKTVKALMEWAKKFKFAITGSFIASENGKILNRAFFVSPNGDIVVADKRHLFTMGGENKYFNSGNKKLVVQHNEFKICVLVCYDIRFPVWSRNVNNEYDLLIYVASFPDARMDAWDGLLPARAIENQSYVCGVNRVGIDGKNIFYSGHSVMHDYLGKCILSFNENESGVKTIEIEKSSLEKFRNKYAFWKDSDIFELK